MFKFFKVSVYKEDLTRVVISYEIYETSLRREIMSTLKTIKSSLKRHMIKEIYETSLQKFCLSYDCFKLDFIAFKVDISIENATLS